jgi:hypothetical protein
MEVWQKRLDVVVEENDKLAEEAVEKNTVLEEKNASVQESLSLAEDSITKGEQEAELLRKEIRELQKVHEGTTKKHEHTLQMHEQSENTATKAGVLAADLQRQVNKGQQELHSAVEFSRKSVSDYMQKLQGAEGEVQKLQVQW